MVTPVRIKPQSLSETADQIRSLDVAVRVWAEAAPLLEDGKSIPVVFATPDRAFSAMQHALSGRLPEGRSETVKKIPLPFASISRGNLLYDSNRFRGVNTKFNKLATTSDKLTALQAPFPLPYDISYRVEFWTKNHISGNKLQVYSALSFQSHEMFLPVDYANVWPNWGIKLISYENDGIIDNSELEPGEGERVFRFTQTMTAKAWLLSDVDPVKTAATIHIDKVFVTGSLNGVTVEDVDAVDSAIPVIERTTETSAGTSHVSFP